MLALASGLDDVVDYAEEAADLLGLYRVEAPMDQAIELADTLAAAGAEVALALGALDGAARRGATPSATSPRSTGSRTRATASCARA